MTRRRTDHLIAALAWFAPIGAGTAVTVMLQAARWAPLRAELLPLALVCGGIVAFAMTTIITTPRRIPSRRGSFADAGAGRAQRARPALIPRRPARLGPARDGARRMVVGRAA